MPTLARGRILPANMLVMVSAALLVSAWPTLTHGGTQPGAVVGGIVLDGRTGQAIEKARVVTSSLSTSTGRDGRFTLAELDPGKPD